MMYPGTHSRSCGSKLPFPGRLIVVRLCHRRDRGGSTPPPIANGKTIPKSRSTNDCSAANVTRNRRLPNSRRTRVCESRSDNLGNQVCLCRRQVSAARRLADYSPRFADSGSSAVRQSPILVTLAAEQSLVLPTFRYPFPVAIGGGGAAPRFAAGGKVRTNN